MGSLMVTAKEYCGKGSQRTRVRGYWRWGSRSLWSIVGLDPRLCGPVEKVAITAGRGKSGSLNSYTGVELVGL